jgi:CheY-like chemotaxis protein
MNPKKILLVEDDYLDVTNVRRALNKLAVDYTLHVAHNGVDALAILNGNTQDGTRIHPDIILLDINMPKMNGLEFLGIIKSYYSLNNIKTFIMTTSAEEYDKVAAENLGISGYILKPLDFSGNRNDDSGIATGILKSELLAK